MPKSLFLFVILMTAMRAAMGQDSNSFWTRVEQLKAGTTLHIKTTHGKITCPFASADTTSLTCAKGSTVHLDRSEILSISVPHRGRSAAVGFGIGAGTGAGIGAGLGQNGQIIGRGGLAAIFAVPLAVVGGLIGLATDFTHSTIYRQ